MDYNCILNCDEKAQKERWWKILNERREKQMRWEEWKKKMKREKQIKIQTSSRQLTTHLLSIKHQLNSKPNCNLCLNVVLNIHYSTLFE